MKNGPVPFLIKKGTGPFFRKSDGHLSTAFLEECYTFATALWKTLQAVTKISFVAA